MQAKEWIPGPPYYLWNRNLCNYEGNGHSPSWFLARYRQNGLDNLSNQIEALTNQSRTQMKTRSIKNDLKKTSLCYYFIAFKMMTE